MPMPSSPPHTGDVMSPPDLDRLLVLPSGCGEQNLVRTAVNWVVAGYLRATGQLQDFLEVKIRNNIMTGMQCAYMYNNLFVCSVYFHLYCFPDGYCRFSEAAELSAGNGLLCYLAKI